MAESAGQKWYREMTELQEKKKREGLTKEEEERLEFMEDKWDDCASD